MKLHEVAGIQWKECSLGSYQIHRLKSTSRKQSYGTGEGIAYMYCYNDENDVEAPVKIQFEYEFGHGGSWDEPPSGGSAEITKVMSMEGRDIPLETLKYDPNDLLEAIGTHVQDQHDAAAEAKYDEMKERGL